MGEAVSSVGGWGAWAGRWDWNVGESGTSALLPPVQPSALVAPTATARKGGVSASCGDRPIYINATSPTPFGGSGGARVLLGNRAPLTEGHCG